MSRLIGHQIRLDSFKLDPVGEDFGQNCGEDMMFPPILLHYSEGVGYQELGVRSFGFYSNFAGTLEKPTLRRRQHCMIALFSTLFKNYQEIFKMTAIWTVHLLQLGPWQTTKIFKRRRRRLRCHSSLCPRRAGFQSGSYILTSLFDASFRRNIIRSTPIYFSRISRSTIKLELSPKMHVSLKFSKAISYTGSIRVKYSRREHLRLSCRNGNLLLPLTI